jgi:hypothetical protein
VNHGIDVCKDCLEKFSPTGKVGGVLLNAGNVRRY